MGGSCCVGCKRCYELEEGTAVSDVSYELRKGTAVSDVRELINCGRELLCGI